MRRFLRLPAVIGVLALTLTGPAACRGLRQAQRRPANVDWTCERVTGLLLRRVRQTGGLKKSLRAKII